MRHLRGSAFSTLSIVYLAMASAAPPSPAGPPQEALITVADGNNCIVEGARLLCADALKHLRDVLKLPAGSLVRVRVEKVSTYESTAKVFELLQKSEYKTRMGYINVSEFPDK